VRALRAEQARKACADQLDAEREALEETEVIGWPWFAGAIALSVVALGHWFALRRTLAVSGRFTALVDRVRHGKQDDGGFDTAAELAEALRAATLAELGPSAIAIPPESASATPLQKQSSCAHLLFLLGGLIGGLASALLAGHFHPVATLNGELFQRTFGASPAHAAPALVVGGALVGFGTRMAAGCTSGHGLCGVSRFQRGSLVATVAFFGMGVVTSFLLERIFW
jgi:hypothetical protein